MGYFSFNLIFFNILCKVCRLIACLTIYLLFEMFVSFTSVIELVLSECLLMYFSLFEVVGGLVG